MRWLIGPSAEILNSLPSSSPSVRLPDSYAAASSMDVKATSGIICDGSSKAARGIPARALIPADSGRHLTKAESSSCTAPAVIVPEADIPTTSEGEAVLSKQEARQGAVDDSTQ